MNVRIFVEGGGSSSMSKRRCRQAFTALLGRCGISARNVQLEVRACGSRSKALRQFLIAERTVSRNDYVALLVDSEDRVDDVERTWAHLRKRDGWRKPRGAEDDQVLLMTTCMETWIVADWNALRDQYGGNRLRENALPSLTDLENRNRHDVLRSLGRATSNRYKKGEESFKVLGKLDPDVLEKRLPSFKRARRILNRKIS